MRTIEQLKNAGFTVKRADHLTGVTELSSSTPFWYHNQKFHEGMSAVRENLRAADKFENGRYVLLAAGEYTDKQVFPFNVIDQSRKALLDEALERYMTAQNAAARAKDDYEDALRTSEL